MTHHQIVSRDEWIAARKELLQKEKDFTRLRDQLSAERRALPWVKVEKEYLFDTPSGRQSLGDLFDGRSQLVTKHFMFGPDWTDGCVGCSFEMDHIEGALVHLEHHDVSYVVVSRAPLAKIEAFRQRMGWRFRWVSSFGSDSTMISCLSRGAGRSGRVLQLRTARCRHRRAVRPQRCSIAMMRRGIFFIPTVLCARGELG
jgi:predicted dithiol-disulfide oxidoreductase (DUF899 family)